MPADEKFLFTRRLILLVKDRGINVNDFFDRHGYDFDTFMNGQFGIDEPFADLVWQELILRSRDNRLGFYLGMQMDLASLGTLGLILQNSRTTIEAFGFAAGLIDLVTDLVKISMRVEDGETFIIIRPCTIKKLKYPTRVQQSCLVVLAQFLKIYEELAFSKLDVKSIMAPRSFSTISTLQWAAAPEFIFKSTDEFILCVDNATLDKKNIYADFNLLSLLLEHISIQQQRRKDYWSNKVEQMLLDNFKSGMLLIAEVASDFNMSPRSLQRKLSNENTSFRKILGRVIINIAQSHLEQYRDPKKTALYLGFRTTGAFSKMFRRLLGYSVSDFLSNCPTK